MTEQICGLILHYKVKKEGGIYSLEPVCTQRVFPSIFCRQLDFVMKIRDKLVITQDTADEEKFEAFSIDLKNLRSDRVNQSHFRHIFSSV